MSLNYTTSYGSPVNEPHAAQRVSTNGPLLLQDFHHIDNLAHLARERIPERLVHAKAAGAHGIFKVTHDLKDITSQKLFQQVGKEVAATVRFSTVAGESGSADTARDVHGFAIKLKTEEGNLDWVLLNTPTFFIRDPGKYPDLVHATKRNPKTNLKDPDMFWDFFSQHPETVHQIMMIFSDRGTPDGFHQQHGFSGTTFKFSKKKDTGTGTDFCYFKLHVKLPEGSEVKTLTASRATELAGTNPDYGTQLLYDAIEAAKEMPPRGQFPRWIVYITMTPDQAMGEYRDIAFDVTKIWPHDPFRLRPIGQLTLNKNPENYFDEIEQLAFAPSNLIPYIEPSPDPLLQARLFIYPDTQRYRLGVNNRQLPCNATIPPHRVANFQRAGAGSFISQGSRPNYKSSTQSLKFDGPAGAIDSQIRDNTRHEVFNGTAYRDLTMVHSNDFDQPHELWKLWTDSAKTAFVDNVSANLNLVKNRMIVSNQLFVFKQVDQEMARLISAKVKVAVPLLP